MVSRVRTSFRVRERGIQRLLHTDIGDLADSINTDAYRSARRGVPQGTNELFNGIRNDGVRYTRSTAIGTISCTAPHVGYVIGGTGGASTVYGNGRTNYLIGAALMKRGIAFGRVNRSPGNVGRRPHTLYAKRFRGQSPNNFLAKALNRAMERHGFFGTVRTEFLD
jgi:hypothetical protein